MHAGSLSPCRYTANENIKYSRPAHSFRNYNITTNSKSKIRHDTLAPYWASAFIILIVAGLSTVWFDFGRFWNSYVLDITGPAWNYILFRGLFTSYKDNAWTRFFTPLRVLIIFLMVCIGIETAQYLELYDSIFDPWDFVAYTSLLIPFYLIDSSVQVRDVSEKES